MGFETDLTNGFAVLLSTAGIGQWRPDGTAYTGILPAITVRKMPEAPNAAITLSTFDVSNEPALSVSVIGLQIMTRAAGADPRGTDDLSAAIFDQLHGRTRFALSTGVQVTSVYRKSSISLGEDDVLRWTTSSNYYVEVWRPGTYRD